MNNNSGNQAHIHLLDLATDLASIPANNNRNHVAPLISLTWIGMGGQNQMAMNNIDCCCTNSLLDWEAIPNALKEVQPGPKHLQLEKFDGAGTKKALFITALPICQWMADHF